MAMYLIDTNVLSEARRRSREAAAWLRSINPESVWISVVTLGEISKGASLKARSDQAAAAAIQRWLDGLRREYADHLLPVTTEIAIKWGELAALRPCSMADGLIAATAILHDKILVTRNQRDFEHFVDPYSLGLVNPWRMLESDD